jgi:hypothetical protein
MKRAPFHLELPDDEVPFSTVTRYALLSGYRPSIVMSHIYNNCRKRIHPYLPGYIEKFSTFFNLCPDSVIKKKTIFPLLTFTQPSDAPAILNSMLKCSDDKVLLSTAIGHSRLKVFYGIKYCPECAQEDITQYGFAYWHIKHQIPGIEACFRHNLILNGVPMGDGNKDRTLFLPPFKMQQTPLATASQVTLSKFSAQLFDVTLKENIDYRLAYASLLKQKGLISNSGKSVSIAKITSLMSEYWKDLPYASHLEVGVPTVLSNYKFVGPMLRNRTHTSVPPLKHLLLACWLTNGQIDSLLSIQAPPPNKANVRQDKNKGVECKVLELLKQGYSLNAVEQRIGKSRCYIRRVAELNQIPHLSNSQSYTYQTRRSVLIKALYGFPRQDIAELLHVSIGYVEQATSNEPNMSRWRRHLRIQKNVLAACKKLKSVKNDHPDWSRTRIRIEAQAAYFMLYNHNKDLIDDILPKPQKPYGYQKDWAEEDQRILWELKQIENIQQYSLSALGRIINDHGHLHRKLHKLLLTTVFLKKMGLIDSENASS